MEFVSQTHNNWFKIMTVSIPLCWNQISTQTQNITCSSAVSTPTQLNMSLQWTAPTLCDHAKHQDSGLHNLQASCDLHYSWQLLQHTKPTYWSNRLATTAYCYICIYIVTQSDPPTNYEEPTENGPLRIHVWMEPDSLYWLSLSTWAIC